MDYAQDRVPAQRAFRRQPCDGKPACLLRANRLNSNDLCGQFDQRGVQATGAQLKGDSVANGRHGPAGEESARRSEVGTDAVKPFHR